MSIREKIISDRADSQFHIHKVQDCDGIIDAVKAARDTIGYRNGDSWRYEGSVPVLVAQQWAKECGAAIGTAEFMAYARRKIMSGDYARLRGE